MCLGKILSDSMVFLVTELIISFAVQERVSFMRPQSQLLALISKKIKYLTQVLSCTCAL